MLRIAWSTLSDLDRVLGLRDLPLAADAGGVDEDVRSCRLALDERVDRVARRARSVVDEHAVLAEHAVQEARLARVRAPDDGDAREAPSSSGGASSRGAPDDGGLEVADAAPVERADRGDLVDAEPVDLDTPRRRLRGESALFAA